MLAQECRQRRPINAQKRRRMAQQTPTTPHISLKVLAIRLLVDHVEQRLRRKPTCQRTANRLVCVLRFLLADLDRLAATSCRRRISHKLRVAALLQADKPEHRLFDGPPDREQSVILQESRFVVAERFGNVLAFLLSQDDAVEGRVEDVVLSNRQLLRLLRFRRCLHCGKRTSLG